MNSGESAIESMRGETGERNCEEKGTGQMRREEKGGRRRPLEAMMRAPRMTRRQLVG